MLDYARETVADAGDGHAVRQRVRWWSALALLRSLASSPAAAAATLRSRAAVADAASPEEADELGRRTVLDLEDDEAAERLDVTPGADPSEPEGDGDASSLRRRLSDLAREAEALCGDSDEKLKKAVKLVDGAARGRAITRSSSAGSSPRPSTWPRELRARLPKGVEVAAVTGHARRPPSASSACCNWPTPPKRVLVCTDCLSEGINLQDHFDAVVHYDLSLEPDPPRAARGPGRPLRPAQPRSSGC